MDGSRRRRLDCAPDDRLAVHGRGRRVRPVGTHDGARPVRRHRRRSRIARASTARHAGRWHHHRVGPPRDVRPRRRLVLAPRRARGRVRHPLEPRLPRAADGALQHARRLAGGPGRVARNGVDADREDGGLGRRRRVPGEPRAHRVLRGDGRRVRGRSRGDVRSPPAARGLTGGAPGADLRHGRERPRRRMGEPRFCSSRSR